MKFCNKTENLQNFTICKTRQYNNTDFVLKISTQNIRILNNLTKEIELKNNITAGEYTRVDFNLLSLITQITLLIVYLIFYNNVKNQSNEVDVMNLSPSDYTLLISEVIAPYDIKDFNQLKSYLETEVKLLKFYSINFRKLKFIQFSRYIKCMIIMKATKDFIEIFLY